MIDFTQEQINFLEEKGYIPNFHGNDPVFFNKIFRIDSEQYEFRTFSHDNRLTVAFLCVPLKMVRLCKIYYEEMSFELFKNTINTLERVFLLTKESWLHYYQTESTNKSEFLLEIGLFFGTRRVNCNLVISSGDCVKSENLTLAEFEDFVESMSKGKAK